jgi:hypothetical protein
MTPSVSDEILAASEYHAQDDGLKNSFEGIFRIDLSCHLCETSGRG